MPLLSSMAKYHARVVKPAFSLRSFPRTLGSQLIFVFLCGLIVFLRMPDRLLNAQFYAEDGFFFEQALSHGLNTLITPYGGYLLTVQRLITLLGTQVKPLYVPLLFNGLTLVVLFTVLFRLLSIRVKLTYKPLLALALVAYPHPEDLFLTMENTMWVLSLVLLIMLFSDDPKTIWESLGDYVFIVLSGLTGVFSFLFVPLFIFKAYLRRSKKSIISAILVGLTAVTQVYFIITAPKVQALDLSPVEFGYIPAIFGYRFVMHLLGGIKFIPLSVGTLTAIGVLSCIGIAVLVFMKGLNFKERMMRLILAFVMGITAAASLFRLKHSLPMLVSGEPLARYMFLPQVALIWLIAQELSFPGLRRRIAIIFFTLFFITSLTYFKKEPLKDMHWKETSKKVIAGSYYDILINPVGWHFRSENSGL